MMHTIGPSILFLLHLLAVLLQLLVCQLVEGVRRFWLWWADWRLRDEQRQNAADEKEDGGGKAQKLDKQFTGGPSTAMTPART